MIENSGRLGDVTAEQRPLQIERALLQFVQRRPRGGALLVTANSASSPVYRG